MRLKDLTGKRFDNFYVKKRVDDYIQPNGRRRAMWLCGCDCGDDFTASGDCLNTKNRIPKGCPSCANKSRAINNRIDVVGKKYNRVIILECLYDQHPTKVRCLCDCGNVFIAVLSDVITGHTKSCGCLQREKTSESNTKNWANVVSEYGVKFLNQDHMNEQGQWLWNCQCGLCDNKFIALPAKVMNGHITSCGCASASSGERFIESILNEMYLKFIPQYFFDDCRNVYPLLFDFAIFDDSDNLLFLIEYDGQQHYKPIDFFGGEEQFLKTQYRDRIKTQYCINKNIPLLRLKYDLSNEEIKDKIYEYHLSVTTAGCT